MEQSNFAQAGNPIFAYIVIGLVSIFALNCWSASDSPNDSGSSLNQRLESLKRELKSIEINDSRLPSLAKQAEDLVKDFEARCQSPHSISQKKVELKHFKNEEGETDVELKPMVQHLNNLNSDILLQVQCSEKLKDAKRLSRKFNRLSSIGFLPAESKPEKPRQASKRKSAKSVAKLTAAKEKRSISSLSIAAHSPVDQSVTVVPISPNAVEKTVDEGNSPQAAPSLELTNNEVATPPKRKGPFDL